MPGALSDRIGKYRERIVEALFLGFLTLPIQAVQKLAVAEFSKPWQLLIIFLPLLLAILWVTYRSGIGVRRFPRLRSLVFFAVYIAAFTVLSTTSLLNWGKDLTVFRTHASRAWLTPNWMGDWRYLAAHPRDADHARFLVVTLNPLPQPDTTGVGRNDLARVIRIAEAEGARGVALDFYFRRTTRFDRILCDAVENVSIPVVTGYTFDHDDDGEFVRQVSGLPCPPLDRQGHLAAFTDWDHVVRSVPTHFDGQPDRPALSVRLAGIIRESLDTPPGNEFQFLAPQNEPKVASFDSMMAHPTQGTFFLDRWVLVGEASEAETFPTPFGERLGVVLHAYAASALLNGRYFKRLPWGAGFAIILIGCYVITVLADAGRPARGLVKAALLISLGIVLLSLACAAFLTVWLDVVYALAAIWLLVPIVLLFRKVGSLTGRPSPA